jgi:hypothetical protein
MRQAQEAQKRKAVAAAEPGSAPGGSANARSSDPPLPPEHAASDSDGDSDNGACPSAHDFSDKDSDEDEPGQSGGAAARNRAAHQAPPAKPAPANSLKDKAQKQRLPNSNLWSTAYLFPAQCGGGRKNIMDRASCHAAAEYICLDVQGCTDGYCMRCLDCSDVSLFRNALLTTSYFGHGQQTEAYLRSKLEAVWDKHMLSFTGPVTVQMPGRDMISLCPAAFAVLCGFSNITFGRALANVRNGEVAPTKIDHSRTESMNVGLVRAYIDSIVADGAEQNPAPGAARTEEAVVTKQAWSARLSSMSEYFADTSSGPKPVGMTMFKKIWRSIKRLREKQASSHSKCDTCAGIDGQVFQLRGLTDRASVQKREQLYDLRAEHERNHLGERRVMDLAGLMAIKYPRDLMTIMADAATQKTYGAEL